jgi:hypothetical protein
MEIRWNETSVKRALGKAILHAVSHLVQMMTSTINSAAASVNATYSSDSLQTLSSIIHCIQMTFRAVAGLCVACSPGDFTSE